MIRQPSPLESFNIAVALLHQAWNETVAKSPSKELLVAAEELTTELTGAVVELRLMRWGPTPVQYLPHTRTTSWPVASARPIAAARAPPAAAAAAAAAEARCGAHGGVTQREAPVPRGARRRARVATAAAEL